MSGRIEDLQGRLNLNLLADSQSGGSTTPDASDAADAEDAAEELAADNPRQQTGTTPSDDHQALERDAENVHQTAAGAGGGVAVSGRGDGPDRCGYGLY